MLKGVSQSTENKFPSLSDKDREKDDKVKEKEKEKKDVIEDLNIKKMKKNIKMKIIYYQKKIRK